MSQALVTIALLPWENLSDDPSDERLLAGFLHDLIAELVRWPAFGTIGPTSVKVALHEQASPDAVAKKLGADFVLTGSFRRRDSALRLNAQLLEVGTQRFVWAERFDGDDLPSAHDELTMRVVNALASGVDRALLQGSHRRRTGSLHAYECWLRGVECLQRGTAEADEEARAFFEKALSDDPNHARAAVGISMSYFNEWSCQSWDKFGTAEVKAYEAALRAETMDPEDAVAQLILGRIEQYRREFGRAYSRLERALALAPNDSVVLIQLAACFTYHGEPERALELARKAVRLNPLGPPWFAAYTPLPLYALGRFEECLAEAARAPACLIVDTPAYKAAAAGHLGRLEEARGYLDEFRADFSHRISPGDRSNPEELLHWLLHVNPYRRQEDIDLLEKGLRLAGLGEKPRSEKGVAHVMNWTISNAFRQVGMTWTLAYKGEVVAIPDLRGLHDIARLLRNPMEAVPAIELSGAVLFEQGIEKVDTRALQNYRTRLREIDEEQETLAVQGDDSDRTTSLEEERNAILSEISKSTGLGGRTRLSGSAREKARTAVTWRIRHAIKKVSEAHPTLGQHLANSIQTGAECKYAPESSIEWH